jgi:hypothetical protein
LPLSWQVISGPSAVVRRWGLCMRQLAGSVRKEAFFLKKEAKTFAL